MSEVVEYIGLGKWSTEVWGGEVQRSGVVKYRGAGVGKHSGIG